MKPRDLSVYDFKEEDELNDICHQWSKLSNPKFDDDDDVAITKYQFLQHASSGSITQMKEFHSMEKVHVVAIDDDDDDHGFVNDISAGPQDSSHSTDTAAHKQEVSVATSDKIIQEQCHMSGDSVEPEKSSLNMKIRISCPRGFPPGISHTSSIPESPYSNGSVETGVSDGCDSIQSYSPSTSGSELEKSYVPNDGLAQDQAISGWNMDGMNDVSNDYVSYGDGIITVSTDYVSYGDKYFPACLILFSKTSLKIVTSDLEEEAGIFRFEWNIDDLHSIDSQWCDKNNRAKVTVRILPRDAVQAENALGMTGIEVFEYLVYDPHWPETQEQIMTLDVRYKALWSIRLNGGICEGGRFPSENEESSLDPYIPIFQAPFEEVVYPKGEADAVSISKRDVDLLEPDTFLNDTIIDFYMMYLKNEIATSDNRRFHFFNSFFFRKLADPDKNSSGVFDGKAAFQRVRKWTRKVNIFDKDYIFIPVNYNLHWSLIVICHPGEVATFKDENLDDSVKVPCILHMDSIRGSHAGLKDLVQSYLLEEWKEKQKETSEDIASKFLNLRFLSLELPQQENCSDCGLFLLHYAELFIAEAPDYFSPFQINKFDNFLKPDWFMPAEASLKRVHIQRLIYELLEGHPSENASPCNINSQPSAFQASKEIDNGIEIISVGRSPRKTWNPLHSQPAQGLDLGLMDMSLYRNPDCTDVSSLGMRGLFQQCQHYDQEASIGQPGCPMPQIKKEVEGSGHLPSSSLGHTELQTIGEVAAEACDLGYTPTGLNGGFQWNSGLSNQDNPEDNLLPSSNCSDVDDSEEMMIIECEQEVEAAPSGENKISDQPEENVDSLTECYESASSDMMETPAEDSQELAKIYGSNNLEDSLNCNQEDSKDTSHREETNEASYREEANEASHREEANEASHREEANEASDQEAAKESSHRNFVKFDKDGNTAGIDEVVEDSFSDTDEEHLAKRLRLTASCDGEEAKEAFHEANEASHEEAKEASQPDCEIFDGDGNTTGTDEVVEDSATDMDEERAAKRIRLTTSGDGERELVISLSKEVQV